MIRWEGLEVFETLDELVAPQHTALLMWDFVRGVVGNTFNSKSMTRSAARLLQAARKQGTLVLYARQNDMDILRDATAPTVRMRIKRWKIRDLTNYRPSGGSNQGSPKWEFVSELKPRKNERVFGKFMANAFMGTSFDWRLRRRGAKTILLTGVNISTGIIATAHEALCRGYYPVIVRDCVGTPSREDYKASIAYAERTFDVVGSSEIIKVWNKVK